MKGKVTPPTACSRALGLGLASALVLVLSLVFVAGAGAAATFDFKFGSEGSGAGQFNQVAGLAANNSNGKIYAADRLNHRIQVFNESGDFIEAWGYDVVASGADDKAPVSEVQDIYVTATAGTFRLGFEGQTTGSIPYNASAGAVESALDALSTVISAGGVSVSGGPGDATGANPYVVTFSGTADRSQIMIERSGLAQPVGTTLECETTVPALWSEGRLEYQWLANGEPIPDATSDTYTTTAADSGKPVQCEVEGIYEQFGVTPHQHAWEAYGDYTLVGSFGSTAPPVPPTVVAPPDGPSPLPSPGPGGALTCNAGAWGNSPDNYTYQWYVGYQPYGSPKTTSSTSDQITLSPADVAAPTSIQCRITATNAGGSATMWSKLKLTSPGPQGFIIETPNLNVVQLGRGSPTTNVGTAVHGGPVFEICKANPPSNDVCQAGVPGPGIGQFSYPRGVAVDNSPSGNGAVVVGDDLGYRVQKFTADGEPILVIGGRVDQATNEHACLISSGHACGVGVKLRTNKIGFLRGSPCHFTLGGCELTSSFFEELGNTVAVDPNNGTIYVNDPGDWWFNSRFIEFRTVAYDSNGGIIGQMFVPIASGFDFAPATSVAVDSESKPLVAISGENGGIGVRDVSEFTLEGTRRPFPERQYIHESGLPLHVSADPDDDRIWLVDDNTKGFFPVEPAQVCGKPETIVPRHALIAVDSEDRRLDCTVPQGLGAIPAAGGLVVTKNDLAFVSLLNGNAIKVYKLPHETAPAVDDTFVNDIASSSARVHGTILPGFEETEVTFEYGTSPCSGGTCTKVPAAETVNGLPSVPVETLVTGLKPSTTYYVRTVATNPFGSDAGPEKTFTTFPFIDLKDDPCPNALARKQTGTADMLDCRAYELASSGFTGGYDVISDLAPGAEPFDGFPAAGDKVLYAVRDGGIPGTGNPTNHGPDPYLATRGENGWTTRYVGIPADGTGSTAPFASSLLDADEGLTSYAFGGPNICSPCFPDNSSGIPVRLPDGSLVQGMAGSVPQVAGASEGYVGNPMSANGDHLAFGSTSRYVSTGNDNGDLTIYDRDLSSGTTQVASTLPSGSTMTGAGIGQLDISDDGLRIVVGRKVNTDAAGNGHWELFMHIGTGANSVDLAPGTTTGVLYLGMSSDGSRVFYSTEDRLVGADTDESADVYAAEVPGPGSITPKLVSVGDGGPSNDDSCEPLGEPDSWNAVSGDGHCNAVGLAGGAGVAGDGTAYFLSPELLTGPGEGAAGEPNLFVVRPGGTPEFVATLDSSSGKTPPPPNHPVADSELVTGLSNPWSIAVDQDSGQIYVAEPESGKVKRFNGDGSGADFTAGPDSGTNELNGAVAGEPFIAQVAFDSATGSPLNGALYATKFTEGVDVYSETGAKLGSLTGFGAACGVAVDQSSGAVYVADLLGSKIWRFLPTSAPSPGVSNANYSVTSMRYEEATICQLAAGSDGQLYAGEIGGAIQALQPSDFAPSAPLREGTRVADAGNIPPTFTLAVDPSTNELYVDTGSKIVILDSDHEKVKEFGAGQVSFFGNGIAVNGGEGAGQAGRAHHVYAVNGSNVVEFGLQPDTFEPIDDPAILNAVNDNEVHHWSDFQTTEDGGYALFTTDQPLRPGYDNAGFRMAYRYQPDGGGLSCLSCLTTDTPPAANASLPTHGLGLTEDGRAFFNSEDQLVLRDQNGKMDAYEWKDGDVSLISTGFSHAPSSLLTVTNDGRNAFFFTRETLVDGDRNGQTMKLYNAREEGGYFVLPPSPPCAASDECHGPSSQAAPAPPIGTYRGTRGNVGPKPKRCKKRFVKRKGKCVRKKRKRGRRGGRKARHDRSGHGRGNRR